MRAFLNKVDVIVPTSENYFASSNELGRYSEKVEVIPIGLNEDTYPRVSNEELTAVRERVGEGFFRGRAAVLQGATYSYRCASEHILAVRYYRRRANRNGAERASH